LICLLPLQAFKGWVDHDVYDDYVTTSVHWEMQRVF